MSKKKCFLFVVLLICFLLTGCGKTNKSVLSVGLKSEVEEMWLKRTGRELSLDSESGYYGMYQGMVVFHSTPEQSAADITEIVIAGEYLYMKTNWVPSE